MAKAISILTLLLYPYVLIAQGYKDLSSQSSIKIKEPSLAYVNITGITDLPTTKTDNMHAWLEYTDDDNNSFRKRIILNAQGASSLAYPKKNLAIDFCEDEWIGDITTSLEIGNWVKQDAFHLKANWIDTFRGGLATATAYKLYDDIVADEQHILERAGIEEYSAKALCHPDGFPCIVSLNGEFYGIYAWQLKKHRKNMGMDKDNPQHVWFQLETYTNSFKTGYIQWKDIDIKNPKTITDESKHYIENLASYHKELNLLERVHSTNEKIREEIAQRFDVQSLINFIIHGLVTSNIDGFGKNAQMFTYDGAKWFIMPYDLDETFGNSWILNFQFPPDWSFINTKYDMKSYTDDTPYTWIMKYYWKELKDRYAVLRTQNVISIDNIMSHLYDWTERVGEDNYTKEYTKWSQCPSNQKTKINKNWEYIADWSEYGTLANYDSKTIYMEGDKCVYKYQIFKATKSTTGTSPLDAKGYTDNYERVSEWLAKRIELLDGYFDYEAPNSTIIDYDKNTVNNYSSKKMIIDGKLYIATKDGYYNIAGQKVKW